ncbi:MAG: hypothetical protein B6D37_10745 [Sphingobacteriales bacterium UTBCD1]|nr:MAG: hypothetical protein B6D37_10745 [Sphingobacteriales bacterium UTBCD1]
MKKTFSAILLVALFLNGSGYYIFYNLRKQELKKAMKEYLMAMPGPENVTEFRFPETDKQSLAKIEWENSHEFWYEGELYDLIEKRTENDQVVIRCVNDEKETGLMKLVQKISDENQGNASSKNSSAILLKLIQASFIPSREIRTQFNAQLQQSYFYFHTYLLPAHREVLTPPPKPAC